jgi:hypothetical protein
MTLQITSDNICRINNKKCTNNKCCSLDNKCTESIDFCNKNDVYNGDSAETKYNILVNNEKQYIYDNNNNILLSKNGRCGIDLKNKIQLKCPNGMYCNNLSFCDESNDNVLELNINNKSVSTQKYDGNNTSRNVKIDKKNFEISTDGKCGIKNNNKICPPKQCCSGNNDGLCGNSQDHCYISHKEYNDNEIDLNEISYINKKYFSGDGALEEYDKLTNEKLQNMYDTDNIALTKNGICGINKDDEKIYKCPPEQCCSKNNICTINLDHCDLENEKIIKLNGIKAIEKYINNKILFDGTCKNNKCPDGQCCSNDGLCGYGKEFCSMTNNNKKNNGTNSLEKYENELYNNPRFCGIDKLTNQIFNCNTNDCCYNNKCGSGFDYCEFADSNRFNGGNALENYKKNRISTDGTCHDKICPDDQCCSNTLKCGTGDSYCNNMNSKFNGSKSLQYKYDKNNFLTDLSLNICGIKDNQMYKCNPGYCCLEDGTCSLDCKNSFYNKYDDNDIIENITFYINDKSDILKLKINELKNINSKFLNITEKKSNKNYAIRLSNNKKYYNNDIFDLINELLNKEYTRNKFNGDNAITNYINNKVLNTYNNGDTKISETNNCYIDYLNNINYRCPANTYCNYNSNVCNICNNNKNKTINEVVLNKLDGKKYDLLFFLILLFLIFLSLFLYYFQYTDTYKNNKKFIFSTLFK